MAVWGVALIGAMLAGPVGTQTPVEPSSPPIFQPGAPGAAGKVISAGEAVSLSRTTFTPADAAFMQHMIVHHAQAVEMVELLKVHGQNPTVKLLGQRIALSQEAEIEIMRTWLTDRAQPLEMPGVDHSAHAGMDHSAHAGHAGMAREPSDVAVMPGMLSPRQMKTLSEARGAAFDRLFLEGMIQHHQGALDMVSELLALPDSAEDPLLSDFTTSVVADQSAEILRMRNVLSDL